MLPVLDPGDGASVQGHANQNAVLAYATTKGAIHALTRAMAVDCAKDGVRVNSISPGSIRTPLLEFAAQQVVGPGLDGPSGSDPDRGLVVHLFLRRSARPRMMVRLPPEDTR